MKDEESTSWWEGSRVERYFMEIGNGMKNIGGNAYQIIRVIFNGTILYIVCKVLTKM